MKKLVCFPSDPIDAYIKKGMTYEYLEEYFNPGGYFDEVYCLGPWKSSRKSFGSITCIQARPLQYRKIIKKIAPVVVRGYGGYYAADWVACSKVKGIPTLISIHDTNTALLYDTVKYADSVICMTESVRQVVLNNISFDQEKVWVMPNRVDTSLFKKICDEDKFLELNKQFGDCKHILHVGRKVKQKNLDSLIKAMKYLDDNHKCIFVGEGDVAYYEKMAEQEGVRDRCVFIKNVKHDELPLWYSWCDCMCTPSRWEGFGFVFIEAAACEAIIVTSNIGPMNEYLTNNENAYLVDDYENPKAIAEAIILAENNSKANVIIKQNARKVALSFDKKKIDELEVENYKKVISMDANGRGVSPIYMEWKYRKKNNLFSKLSKWGGETKQLIMYIILKKHLIG